MSPSTSHRPRRGPPAPADTSFMTSTSPHLPTFTQASACISSSAYPSTNQSEDYRSVPSPSNSGPLSGGDASSSSASPPAETIPSHYVTLMNKINLPDPGLSYYEARRAIWLEPPPIPPTPVSPSPSRIKLEALLSQPGAVESEEVWKAGLKNVWKGLVGGNQLRKRLPLSIVLKILQAGWLRDGTWPEGSLAPPSDENAPAEVVVFPPIGLPPGSQRVLLSRRPQCELPTLDGLTPDTAMGRSPMHSPTQYPGVLGAQDEIEVEQPAEAIRDVTASMDITNTNGDGRHEGG